ncbi:MAG: hypothetical protein EXR52_06015 [Dehalococcoidia bacterium]|nr:hypothetical protein [Dehalococcoidia bacterium]
MDTFNRERHAVGMDPVLVFGLIVLALITWGLAQLACNAAIGDISQQAAMGWVTYTLTPAPLAHIARLWGGSEENHLVVILAGLVLLPLAPLTIVAAAIALGCGLRGAWRRDLRGARPLLWMITLVPAVVAWHFTEFPGLRPLTPGEMTRHFEANRHDFELLRTMVQEDGLVRIIPSDHPWGSGEWEFRILHAKGDDVALSDDRKAAYTALVGQLNAGRAYDHQRRHRSTHLEGPAKLLEAMMREDGVAHIQPPTSPEARWSFRIGPALRGRDARLSNERQQAYLQVLGRVNGGREVRAYRNGEISIEWWYFSFGVVDSGSWRNFVYKPPSADPGKDHASGFCGGYTRISTGWYVVSC